MNVFDLAAKLTLDSSQFSSELTASEKLANGFASALGSIAGKGIKAVEKLTEQAIQSYSAYQQLSGGVEQLFGADARIVTQYAQNAYKTAGINASNYLELATNFSAALINGLGGDTEKAAEYVDKAIVDMSDNVNTFGTSMQSVAYAYKGFAKQTYTMLDNLKLGYGGTKDEMKRLLDDASALSGQKYDISNLNDIIDAIHVIQDNLKITGKTVQESENTIEGSMKTARAAWDNLITEFGKPNANIGARVHEWAQAATNSVKNVLPVIKNVLSGLGEALQAAWPEVKAVVGELWTVVEPVLQEVWGHVKETVSGWMNDLLSASPVGNLISTLLGGGGNSATGISKQEFAGFFNLAGNQQNKIVGEVKIAGVAEATEEVSALSGSIETVPEEVATTAVFDSSGAISGISNYITELSNIPPLVSTVAEFVSDSGTHHTSSGYAMNAKSMSGGTILRGATMFGWDRNGIPQIGGGEGPEAVVGVNSLDHMIRESVNGAVSGILNGLGGITQGGQRQPVQLVLDTGVLVAAIAPSMNDEMSRIDTWRHGGDR